MFDIIVTFMFYALKTFWNDPSANPVFPFIYFYILLKLQNLQ